MKTAREIHEKGVETMWERKEKRERMERFKEMAKNHCYKCANSSHVFKIGKQSHIHCLIEPMENQGWGSCRFIFDTCEKFKIKQANERGGGEMSVSICKHEKFYSAVIDGVGTHHDTLEKAQEYLRNKVKILAYAVDSAIDTANDYEYNLKLQADKTAKTQEAESE